MDKDYYFCVRACNGINKCNEYCKLSDKELVTYASPKLPKIPKDLKEIETETCCTYMTIQWDKHPDTATNPDDKNTRDYWLAAVKP